MTNYCMKIKLALIGDSFCRRGQCTRTDTWVRILEKHYVDGIDFVVQGRENGSTLADKLADIDLAFARQADIILVFHEPQNEQNTEVYRAEQQLIYQKLQHTPARVWHFQDSRSANLPNTQHPVDKEIMNYPHDWFPEHRYCVPYTESDNGVDATGNRQIARLMIGIIDEYKQSLAGH